MFIEAIQHVSERLREINIKKNKLNRNRVITGQYILKVMKHFIEIVKLELIRDEGTQVQLSWF